MTAYVLDCEDGGKGGEAGVLEKYFYPRSSDEREREREVNKNKIDC